jgi:Ca-activated chloride channel family protein
MNRSARIEIERRLEEPEGATPPADLLSRLRADIPDVLPTPAAAPAPANRRWRPARWAMAASLLVAVLGAFVVRRAQAPAPDPAAVGPRLEDGQSKLAAAQPAPPPPPPAAATPVTPEPARRARVVPPPPVHPVEVPQVRQEAQQQLKSLGYVGDRFGSDAVAFDRFEESVEVEGQAPAFDSSRLSVSSTAEAGPELGRAAPPDDMFFRDAGRNPAIDPRRDPLSTFGLDVDTGSFSLARSYFADGNLPPRQAIRVEEFVNAMTYETPRTRTIGRGDPVLDLLAEGAPTPFGRSPHDRVIRLAVAARSVDPGERKPAVLTFVVDTSGSMDRENRLGLVKRSLTGLLGELREDDRVGLVIYDDQARVVVRPTHDLDRVQQALQRLTPGGSTNAEDGLVLAYEVAGEAYESEANNRVILASDGVANVGSTGPESILERIGREARRGIYLTTVGFGMGNYNDALMEQLADQGNGQYAYVDSLAEARRIFQQNLDSTLETVARDAKAQVEFDARTVERYRLVGYENRDIADQQFRDDRVDAGEIGAGHRVTALYEVRLRDEARASQPLLVFRVRYRDAETRQVEEIRRTLAVGDLDESWWDASRDLRLAAIAGAFADRLRGDGGSDLGPTRFWELLRKEAAAIRPAERGRTDQALLDLRNMVDRAARLERDESED